MKRIKKLASILLAMVMVLSMGLTVFAAGTTPPTDTTPEGNTVAGKGSFTITINDTTKGYIYKAYQIFSGDLSKEGDTKTLSNIEWGSGVDVAKAEVAFPDKSAAEVAATLEGVGFDAQAAQDFAAKIGKCLSDTAATSVPTTTGEGENQTITGYKIAGLTAGYYLVLNSSVPTVDGDHTRYMMEVVGDVTATPKRGTLEHDKNIVHRYEKPDGTEGVDYWKANEAPIGGKVEYNIPVTLPQNFADYKTYYLKFEDTLTKGLTFDPASVKVMAGDQDVTKYFYKDPKVVTGLPEETGTKIEVSISDLKSLNNIDGITITATTPIVLSYTATLNENAVIGTEGNPNYVKVVHSNDPNNSGDGTTTPPPENPDKPTPNHPTGETPDKEVITYTTELTILKTDKESGAFLPGVEFTLTGDGVKVVLVTEETFTVAADGEYWKLKDGTYTKTAPTIADDETDNTADYESTETKYTKTTSVVAKGEGKTETNVVGTVQADGTVTFRGLGAGTYTITETKTLPGYNTIDPITFTVSFDATKTPMFASNSDKVTVGTDNLLDTAIENQKGSLLPSTGGIGTTIFYVVGAVLAIGAGILLVTKKRMSAR